MGGAGLALPRSNGLNPGQLGIAAGDFRLPIPTIEYRANGRDIGQITGYLSRMRRSGLDPRQFTGLTGGSIHSFGGSIGLSYGATSMSYFARGYEELLPSSAALDVYGVDFEGYHLSHGHQMKAGRGKLSLGATAKLVTAYYDHQRSTAAGVARMAGAGSEQQSGLGLDFGFVFQPDYKRDLYYGLSVTNLISPGIRFDRTLPNGTHGRVEPFRTTVSAGVSGALGDRTWFACDGIDLTNAIGRQQLAVGLEHGINRYLSLQIGYNSRTAFTIGLSVLGITARVAGRTPLTLESGFRF
jgi:hypothetical protein